MKLLRLAGALLVSIACVVALGFGSRANYAPPGGTASGLRLSWRLRGQRIEHCRQRTAAELEALPAHMRTREVCTSRLLSYRLVLRIDQQVDTLLFAPAGAKADRPIFVLHEVRLPPGAHDVSIELAPLDASRRRRALRYRGTVLVQPGAIVLITMANGCIGPAGERRRERDDDDEHDCEDRSH